MSLASSTMSISGQAGGQDPIKINQLFEKIEKSNNLEIEERNIKNLSEKFRLKLIDGAFVAQNNPQYIASLLGWLTKRFNQASNQGYLNCLSIFRHISLKQEGKILLRQIGCLELFDDLLKQASDPSFINELSETMKNLVSENVISPSASSRILSPPTISRQQVPSQTPLMMSNLQSKHQQLNSNMLINSLPEREEHPSFQQTLGGGAPQFNPFAQTTFNKKDFSVRQEQSTMIQQRTPAEQNQIYMESMHKQQQLKEVCELPYVMLCDEDEKTLFDLGVQLKFGELKNIMSATQKIANQSFYEFPIEVFLQRTEIIRALIDLLEGSQAVNAQYTNLAQPALIVFVQRLRTLYQYQCSNLNKVSHMSLSERDAQVPSEPHLIHCYPCNHNGKWSQLEELQDTNKYGATTSTSGLYQGPKPTSMTAANISNSLSSKAVLGLILTKSINLLKDTEKIGLYVQLIEETLETLVSVYRVEGNPEFSEILHLYLFSFDGVFDYYKDAVFNEILISSVLTLAVKFITLLNSITSDCKKKYQLPFTECLYLNTTNGLQRMLRRALFKGVFDNNEQKNNIGKEQQEILKFFERLENELPQANTLQKNVTQSFTKAQDVYQKFQTVQSYRINADGLMQNDDSSMIFIESLTQYYQSMEILEVLQHCIQLRMDFPFEHLITDCIMYGILANESSLDSRLDQLEKLFTTYLSLPFPEVRERIIRKLYSKLKIHSSLTLNKKSVANTTLLSKFLYRKTILNHFINKMLINPELANEETRLQMNLATVIIKTLIIAYNEGGQLLQKNALNNYFLTFHSLVQLYPDIVGLMDLIEENAPNKQLRFHRLLRDLFNQDQAKREFATSVLRSNLSKEGKESPIKDLVSETFDLQRPFYETANELDNNINRNYDSSTMDILSIQNILMSSASDFSMKKSCLEQLTLILFDMTAKRGKMLFKQEMSSGVTDLFTFLVAEIVNTFNTCQGYLKNSMSFIDLSQQSYINECFKFIFYSAILYPEEPVIKTFFDKLKQLAQSKSDKTQDLTNFEKFLNASLFFAGSFTVRANALKALFITVFQPVIINTKISKQQLPTGALKKSLSVYVADFACNSFIMMVPFTAQVLKSPLREELVLSEEQVMFITQRVQQQDKKSEDSHVLKQVCAGVIAKIGDKNENFNNVMRVLEVLQNYILSLQTMRDELVNTEVMNSLVELIKILPTRDFEFSFLADYFMVLSQILMNYTGFKQVSNIQLFVNRLGDALKHHLLPFLIESGYSNFQDMPDSQITPKFYFIQRFLELINHLLIVDTHLKNNHRLSSGLQQRVLSNISFIDYMLDLYQLFKQNMQENRRKLQVFFSLLIINYDTKHIQFERITELLMNSIATHKMSLLFDGNSVVMLAIRSLIILHQRRLAQPPRQLQQQEEETLSVSLQPSTLNYMNKFQSFGWILRFIESRDSRVRVLAWDLVTEIFDYEFLKSSPSIIQSALNAYLKHQELFSVKISVLKFLIKSCEALIYNCDVFQDFENERTKKSIEDSSYIGSATEQMSVKTLLQMISKQGLITHMHVMLSQKDTPLLFVTLTIKLLHKLTLMDHKRALPVLTQLDYWTFLVEMINPQSIQELESHENRLILKHLKQHLLRIENPTQNKDMIMLVLNSILEFIFEGFKRDAQIANMLIKTTKLMTNIFDTLKTVINQFNTDCFTLTNKNLLIIFFDKVVKLLHVALMHPRDYSTELISKFLNGIRTVTTPDSHQEQRNWIYITEIFRIINLLSGSCSYLYGQIEVKLSLSRFIAEFLLRDEESSYQLDEMVGQFDGSRLFDENEMFTREELRTYGSLILIEMSLVFKGLYMDKDQKAKSHRLEDMEDHENSKIDITTCISILLAKCKSAKTVAIDQNLLKKVLEICQENASALHLADLQKLTSKPTAISQKSILGKSTLSQNQSSLLESQIKRQYKYAQYSDTDLCEREVKRMLIIIRHLFFNSGELLIDLIKDEAKQTLQQSKISTNTQSTMNKKQTKKSESLGERMINLWGQIMEELGSSNDRYQDIIHETMRSAITFASQNLKFKAMFATMSLQSSNTISGKKNTLLKLFTDKILSENIQGSSLRMKYYFTLLRTLSLSTDVAKEMMKFKTIEEIIQRIQINCKNSKDIKIMKHFLANFTSFLAGFSCTEEGQKILLKIKELYEFSLFALDTVVLPENSTQTGEAKTLINLVTYNLLFLRNSSFTRMNKLHILSNPLFLPCLITYLTQQQTLPLVKSYSAACLWVLLFNHQGVKAMLNKPDAISELQLLRQEYQRVVDIENYQYYINQGGSYKSGSAQTNYVMPEGDSQEHKEEYTKKRCNEFTLQALNGILSLLQQGGTTNV